MRLTVLYDAGCPLCTRFREWLADQPVLVPLDLVPVGSAEARRASPRLAITPGRARWRTPQRNTSLAGPERHVTRPSPHLCG